MDVAQTHRSLHRAVLPPIWRPEAFDGNKPAVRDCACPDGLDEVEERVIATSTADMAREHLLAHCGLDAIAADKKVAVRRGPVLEVQRERFPATSVSGGGYSV